jgi:hypothetical protein
MSPSGIGILSGLTMKRRHVKLYDTDDEGEDL